MSDSDSFIVEVTEEVRRDKMYALWRKYGVYAIAVLVAIVGGAAVKSWHDHSRIQASRESGGAFLAAAKISDAGARSKAFAALTADAGPGFAALADLRAADALIKAGDVKGASEILAGIAGDGGLDPVYRDLAGLKDLALTADDADAKELIRELEGLAAPGAPYRLLALEAQANAHLRLDDIDAARRILQEITSDPTAPQALHSRAAALIKALGVDAVATS